MNTVLILTTRQSPAEVTATAIPQPDVPNDLIEVLRSTQKLVLSDPRAWILAYLGLAPFVSEATRRLGIDLDVLEHATLQDNEGNVILTTESSDKEVIQ